MKLDSHYEVLSKLYLRLNGYLVSNLIIHSSNSGECSTEIDIIGVRMPFHEQSDRKVSTSEFLNPMNNWIEIIIADVKNVKANNKIKFNSGLRNKDESIKKLIAWIGCYETITEKDISEFKQSLNSHNSNELKDFVSFKKDFPFGKFNFKFTFFCPQLEKWNNKGYKYIHFEEISYFIWHCLNKQKVINSCSRKYNYELWNEFEKYVIFFKDSKLVPSKEKFENHFKNE